MNILMDPFSLETYQGLAIFGLGLSTILTLYITLALVHNGIFCEFKVYPIYAFLFAFPVPFVFYAIGLFFYSIGIYLSVAFVLILLVVGALTPVKEKNSKY